MPLSTTRGPHTGVDVGKGRPPTVASTEHYSKPASTPIVEKHNTTDVVEGQESSPNIVKHLKRIVRHSSSSSLCVTIHKSRKVCH